MALSVANDTTKLITKIASVYLRDDQRQAAKLSFSSDSSSAGLPQAMEV